MEAQRMLRRLGFIGREARRLGDGTPTWFPTGTDEDQSRADLNVGSLVSRHARGGGREVARAGEGARKRSLILALGNDRSVR